ncbi:hypothetical protein [Nitratidesulfovibrio oxamicus]|uniref:hypothetical protein n=1 Tax=Nitratidesulfovibrio oxamicus TaxID=32016 RepID=UPI0018C85326|nr:hypothetical protein [Nitratidesulfovibrio oxamicus]
MSAFRHLPARGKRKEPSTEPTARNAIAIGGARGTGRAIAQCLARDGSCVLVNCVNVVRVNGGFA